jgi:hypothetical protein
VVAVGAVEDGDVEVEGGLVEDGLLLVLGDLVLGLGASAGLEGVAADEAEVTFVLHPLFDHELVADGGLLLADAPKEVYVLTPLPSFFCFSSSIFRSCRKSAWSSDCT